MKPDEMRDLLQREPFEPFRIRLGSGDSYPISDPNSIALGKNRMFIAFSDSDRWAACPYLHVAAVESIGNGHTGNGRRRKRRK
jgi:hypothetical protein